jgi:sigma-E factor negative regulatory protein RseA
MNETMTQTSPSAAQIEADHWRECLSALVDGELNATELDGLMAAIERDPELQAVWARYQTLGPLVVRAHATLPQAPAANDPVFWRRWALAASLVAISTVTWGLLEQAATDSATLAQGRDTVWLSSAVGPMMRDPVLEELLQEHRELGDGGALQVSTGFLRSATLRTTP